MNKHKIEAPNILLITADQLRFDYVGCYQKAGFMDTPVLDALAEEGCRFENAYSPNPVCIPARHNLITGLTARHHGFDDNYFGPTAKSCPWYLPTFAQILNDGGYKTAAIGKMHFQPERRSTGFDLFLNADEVVDDIAEDEYALDLRAKGFTNASYHGVRNALYMQPQQCVLPEEMHGSHWIADKSIEFIRNSTESPKPFLLWTGFKHPHPPFDIPPAWAHKYDGKIPPHTSSITPLSKLAEENKCIADLPNEESINRMRELYACAVSYVDWNVGRIIDALKETGAYENTLIIFTADHGEMLGDLDTYQKFLPYDASCRVPMIFNWPKGLSKHGVRKEFVDLNDLMPTMLDAAGLDYPAEYDLPGESVLAEGGVKNRTYQYVEHQRDSKRWCCIMDEQFKYVHYYGDNDQMFDRINDPEEKVDLLYQCENEQTKGAAERLRKVLVRYEARYGLKGYVEHGEFVEKEPYKISTYRECCFPSQTVRYPGDKEKLQTLDQEILAAIENEPVVKLSQLDIHGLLVESGQMSEEQYQAMMEKAKEINRY